MPCPKCGGMARRLDLVTAEGRLMVNSCINCGRVFGDAVIDYHQGRANQVSDFSLSSRSAALNSIRA